MDIRRKHFWFGAAGSSPDFSRVFHDQALLGLCLELSFLHGGQTWVGGQTGFHWNVDTIMLTAPVANVYHTARIIWHFFLCIDAPPRTMDSCSQTDQRLKKVRAAESSWCWTTSYNKNSKKKKKKEDLRDFLRLLRTKCFPRKCGDFFCSNHHYHMLITGNKKICGYLDEILHQSGVENGHSNEKIAEKTSLFFSALAKSAMNWCLVAVFFSLVLGSSVRKTSGRRSRDCLEKYRGVFVIN